MPPRGKCWFCGEIASLTPKLLRNEVTGSLIGVMICEECKRSIYEEGEGLRVPDGLTNMGYDQIFECIINRTVQPPEDLTVEMLNAWLTGYATCQNDVLEIIGKLKDQYGR